MLFSDINVVSKGRPWGLYQDYGASNVIIRSQYFPTDSDHPIDITHYNSNYYAWSPDRALESSINQPLIT